MSNTNEQLNGLMGRKIEYKQTTYELDSWHIADGRVHILTDSSAIILNKSEVSQEISKMKIINLPEKSNGVMKRPDFNTLNSVEDVLMNTIKNVEANPDYVHQAKAINSSVSQLVNVARVKIEMMKLHSNN